MTTWENTDSIDMENVTVTSDVAYERVTSDEHFEDEPEKWYLQQNTSWLVQEIPNISFLDIADTLIEQKKTLFQRNNWNVVVWKEWKSIEVIPQDSLNLWLGSDTTISTASAIPLDLWVWTQNSEVIEAEEDEHWNPTWAIKILKDWYYRISYWWTVDSNNATDIVVALVRKRNNTNKELTWDRNTWLSYNTIVSWWRTIWCSLEREDTISLWVSADSSIDVLEKYTYLEIQYVRAAI